MRRILIVGCHRSGTTLMRLVLDSHPLIHCFDEWKAYDALKNDEFANAKNAEILGFKIPNWTEYLVDCDDFKKYYQEDDYILFMLRDVRAVVASMLSLRTKPDRVWFQGAVNAVTKKWPIDPKRKFLQTCGAELAKIETMPLADYRKAALYWRYKTSKYLEMVTLGWRVVPVFYEKFVDRPESHMRILMKTLNIPWSDMLMQHHQMTHDEVTNGMAVGNTNAQRAVDTGSVNKWEDVLTADQQQAILETAGELNDYVSHLRR
jgi:protein-tyrosine sulfotransferase